MAESEGPSEPSENDRLPDDVESGPYHEAADQATGVTASSGEAGVTRRRRKKRQRVSHWISDYGQEILLLAVVILGVLLLWNPGSIFGPIFAWNRSNVDRSILVTGLVLLLFVFVFGALRLRRRMNHYRPWWDDHCPQCDTPNLHRIHRRSLHHLAGLLGVPVRRYFCSQCGWRGIRIDTSRI